MNWYNVGLGTHSSKLAFGLTTAVLKEDVSVQNFKDALRFAIEAPEAATFFAGAGMTTAAATALVEGVYDVAYDTKYPAWPRANRWVTGFDGEPEFESNMYLMFVCAFQFYIAAGFLDPTSVVGSAASSLVDTCMTQIQSAGSTELFCTFEPNEIVLALNVFHAIFKLLGWKMAPFSGPLPIGFAAARLVAGKAANTKMMQYGIAGSFLSSVPLWPDNLYTGDAVTDKRVLDLYIDKAVSLHGSRYVADTTAIHYEWA